MIEVRNPLFKGSHAMMIQTIERDCLHNNTFFNDYGLSPNFFNQFNQSEFASCFFFHCSLFRVRWFFSHSNGNIYRILGMLMKRNASIDSSIDVQPLWSSRSRIRMGLSSVRLDHRPSQRTLSPHSDPFWNHFLPFTRCIKEFEPTCVKPTLVH